MKIGKAVFVKSSAAEEQCPSHTKCEFAFIGRSNVGKSSLINMLCQRKNLAKTSSRPGKTQLINHFLVDDRFYIVDLPGYGWSAVSKKRKAEWGVMIESYLLERRQLACLFVLLDSRHGPQEIDYDFIHWLGTRGVPFALVFTKSDKVNQRNLQANMRQHQQKLHEDWSQLPPIFYTSAINGRGRTALLQFIADTIDNMDDTAS